jgi:phosphoribosylamine--glycine ligase
MACVLVIGGGGREHAMAWALANSPRVDRLICAPGNAGTAAIGENVAVDPANHDALVGLANARDVAITVVGPEAPLCAGVVDRFEREGLRIFGPTAAAARIEGDKAYAKRLMKLAKVPTAEGRIFNHHDAARAYVASRDTGVVVKAAGLAAGKGVSVCEDPADALIVLEKMMVARNLGDAANTVVVEEILKGPELSVFALVDGQTIYVLETAQDHKRVGEGDTGPNTGGMGAYSPAAVGNDELTEKIERDILVPIVDALRNDGAAYRGLLYAGLILTAAGPKVLEFNCRFGDPETQPLLMRLESDFYALIEAVVEGRLAEADVRWSPKPAVCVVMSSQGYPGSYNTGKVIEGLERAGGMADVQVFQAGTKRVGERTVTSGGRVLGVTALGADITDARLRAYAAAEAIQFEGAYFRRDIAAARDRGVRESRDRGI